MKPLRNNHLPSGNVSFSILNRIVVGEARQEVRILRLVQCFSILNRIVVGEAPAVVRTKLTAPETNFLISGFVGVPVAVFSV